MKHARQILTLILTLSLTTQACAWSAGGHHIVSLIAFDLLPRAEQNELLRILEQHPRFAEDFTPRANVANRIRWAVGRAGVWPDVARSQPRYNRPTWHYQLGSTITIGNANVPDDPGPLPPDANLDTQDLYAIQAIELCFNVLRNRRATDSDRALAICWLAHLVGDIHQPCHAGSLYVEGVFPDGDRGANGVPVKQGRNLHSLWDGLLGRRYYEGDINRRLAGITGDRELLEFGRNAVSQSMDGLAWVEESRTAARQAVYTPEVMGAVSAAARGLSDGVGEVYLAEDYLKNAGQVARIRVTQAGWRLAEVWRLALAGE